MDVYLLTSFFHQYIYLPIYIPASVVTDNELQQNSEIKKSIKSCTSKEYNIRNIFSATAASGVSTNQWREQYLKKSLEESQTRKIVE